MATLIGVLIAVLIVVILVQVGKVAELSSEVKGEENGQSQSDKFNAAMMLGILVFGFYGAIASAIKYNDKMHIPLASEHGAWIDELFWVTMAVCGVVFILTQILLFWFAYKYRYKKGNKNVDFFVHSTKLEIWWTLIPAVVMTFLVISGLQKWNKITSEAPEDAIELEATGYQFAWDLRYPGPDGKLGGKNFRKISGTNPLGQVWEDKANHDDFMPNEIHIPVGKPVKVRINAKDVLHNFYLPHFRVKMDAVPGMPTQFWFTPTKTTKEMREELGNPDFNYELACAELCGRGHFSMRRLVVVETEEEYNEWLSKQVSTYELSIKGTDADPYNGIANKDVEKNTNTVIESGL